MKISTKGRYALEAMVDLAYNGEEKLVSLKHISQRINKSKNYLEQLFVALRKAEIVSSVRGAQGGYKLAKNAKDITAGEIVRAVEGELAVVHCIERNNCELPCENEKNCSTQGLWIELKTEINRVLDSVTLDELVACYKDEISRNKEIEYYI
ncbi:MAG TPA: AsnC family transcriptional regulator [Eubacteriaceae bacterium]|nr:AsnC family transcriptional regulator [Eubacteriaceae bacterium]